MMRRTTVFTIILAGAGLTMAAAFGELAVRAYAAVDADVGRQLRAFDPLGAQIEPHGRLGYRQRPNATFHYVNGTTASSNAMGFRGPAVSPRPAPGMLRVVLLGGSTTHGWGVPDAHTIDAHLRTLLGSRFPDRRIEVVNLAFDGYDAYQLLERLQTDGLPLSPHLVVLNTGINDVRNARFPALGDPDPRTLIWEVDLARMREDARRGGPTLWSRVKHYSFLARSPGFVRSQLQARAELRRRATEESGMRAAGHGVEQAGAPAGGPPYPEAADLFERNVRRMVALARDRGIPVLLSTPPSALPYLPPTARSTQSYWIVDARTTQRYRDTLEARLRRVADDEAARGGAVRHIAPRLAFPLFLDDCHLTGEGNRAMAEALATEIAAMIGMPQPGIALSPPAP